MTAEERRVIKAMKDAFSMTKQRCYNPKTRDYKRYGARGITICSRWLDNFDNLLADMGLRPDSHTLERIDNNGPYSPENCVWATRKTQGLNKENTLKVTYKGKTQTIREWSEELGIEYWTLKARVKRLGYSPEEALTKKVKCGGLLPGRVYKERRKPDMSNVPRGFDSPHARVSKPQAAEMKVLHREVGMTYSMLAILYGVTVTTASNAVQGKGPYAPERNKNDKDIDIKQV